MDIVDLVTQPILPAKIDLFKIDCTGIVTGNPVFRLTSNVNNDLITSVEWGGEDYLPYPCNLEGIESSVEGAFARPTFTVANLDDFFGTLSFFFDDISGAKITYIQTFECYVNQNLSIAASLLNFKISHSVAHDNTLMVWELWNVLDDENLNIPLNLIHRDEFPGATVNKIL